MTNLRHLLVRSEHPAARAVRRLYRGVRSFTLPAPRVVVTPALGVFLILRSASHFALRVLVCEPLFKAYCRRHGRGVRTGVFIHWVQGKGDILLGDDVLVDGKCSISFAARFAERPALEVGDHTIISHDCSFAIGRRITIGRHCLIARGVWMFDSSGHPTDPAARLAGLPPEADKVRPITIGDNVWIGSRSLIFPGTTIGEGSVVAAGSAVRGEVPSYTLVAGNPARQVASLRKAPERPPAAAGAGGVFDPSPGAGADGAAADRPEAPEGVIR
jgi:acetyltransferase-like isoleucine patch superfamily enzyme